MSADNIKVAIKARPLLKKENDNKKTCQWKIVGNSIQQIDSQSEPFYFDHIFDRDATNQELFDMVAKPIVDATLKGFNGTIFAYGQTSSGKTYTMLGEEENPGVVDLAAKEIFKEIEAFSERVFLLRVGYIEIYNEKIYDLLNKDNKDLKIHEAPTGDATVNCTEHIITSETQIIEFLTHGNKSRKIGETLMNERSSRSHAIFRIIIESRERDQTADESAVQISNLNLVDLAGSERADQTGASGSRLKEGAHINKSLLSLSCVISKLSENESDKYINYRDSKLTRILQASLGGNALTAIICTIKPSAIEETNSTLNFAMRAKCIKNKPRVNEVVSGVAMMKRLEKEIARLEEELAEEKSKNSHMKIAVLENKIRENELKIVIPNTSNLKLLADKGRRRTWCPSATNSSPVFPKPVIENTNNIQPTNHMFASSKAHMTPLITLRENCSEVPMSDFRLDCHFEENYTPAEDLSFFKSPNVSKIQCNIKTPKVFRKTERDSVTPTMDKYEDLKQEYEELKDFTDLEKQIDVKHETLAVLHLKLQDAQEKSMQFEIERSKFKAFQDDYLEIEKRYNELLKQKEEYHNKEEEFKQREEQFTQKEEQFKQNDKEFKEKEEQFKLNQDQFKHKEEEYKSRLDENLKEISKLKLDYQKLESIEYEKEQHQKIAKLRQDDLLSIITEKEGKIEALEKHIEQMLQTAKDSTSLHSENIHLNNEIQELNKKNSFLKGICEKSSEMEVQLHELTKKYENLLESKNQIQNEYLELSNQLMEAVQDSDNYQARCNEYESSIQNSKEKYTELEKVLLLKQEEISSLEESQKNISAMYEEKMEQLKPQNEFIVKIQEENSTISNQMKQLQILCDELRQKLEDYHDRCNQYETNIHSSKEKYTELEKNLLLKQEQISSLEESQKNMLALHEEKIVQLETENVRIQEENSNISNQMNQLQVQYDELTPKLEDYEKQTKKYMMDAENLKKQCTNLESDLVTKQEKISCLESEINASSSKLDITTEELKKTYELLLSEKNVLSLANDEKDNLIKDLHEQMIIRENEIKKSLDELNNKILSLDENLLNNQNEILNLQSSNTIWQNENENQKSKLKILMEKNSQLTDENSNLEQLKVNIEISNTELIEAKARLDQIENENSNLVQNLCSKIVQLEAEINRLHYSPEIQDKQIEIAHLSTTMDEIKIKQEKEDSPYTSRSKSLSQDSLEQIDEIKPKIEKVDKSNEVCQLIADSVGSQVTFLKNTLEYLIENQYEQSGRLQNVDKTLSFIEIDHEEFNRLKEENSSLKCTLEKCIENVVVEKQPSFMNEVENIQKQNNDLMQKLVQLEEDLTGKDQTKMLIEEQNKILMMEIENVKNLNNDLVNKLQSNKDEICSLYENQVENYTTELNKLKESKESLQIELDILKEDHNRKKDENTVLIEQQNNNLKKEIEHLKNDYNEFVEKLKNKSEEICSLETSNQCLQDKLNSIETDIESTKQNVEDKIIIISSLQEEIEHLKNDNNEFVEKLKNKEEEIGSLEKHNQSIQDTLKSNETDIESMKENIEDKTSIIASLKKKLSEFENKLIVNNNETERLRSEINEKNNNLRSAKDQLNEGNVRLNHLQEQLDNMQKNYKTLEESSSQLLIEKTQKDNENRVLKESLSAKEEIYLNVCTELHEMKSKLEKSIQHNTELLEKVSTGEKLLSTKHEILESIKEEKSNLEIQFDKNLKQAEDECKHLKNSLSQLEEMVKTLEIEKSNLQKDRNSLELDLSRIDLKTEEKLVLLKAEMKDIQQEKAIILSKLDKAESIKKELEDSLKTAISDCKQEQEKIVKIENNMVSYQEEIKKLKCEKTDLIEGRNRLQNEKLTLEESLKNLSANTQKEKETLQQKIKELKSNILENADTKKEKEALEQKIKELHSTIIDNMTTISKLKSDNENLYDKHKQLEIVKTKEFAALKNNYDKLTADIKFLKIRENDKNEVLKQFEDNISSITKEKTTIQDEFQLMQTGYECNTKKLQQEIEELCSRNEKLCKKNIEVSTESQARTLELKQLQIKLDAIQKTCDSLLSEKNKLDENIRLKSSEYLKINFEFTSLQKRFDSLTNENKSLKGELDVLTSKDSQQEEKIRKFMETQSVLTQNAKDKTQQYEKLQEQSNILAKQYQALKSDNEKLTKLKSNLDVEIKLKSKEIAELKERCKNLQSQIVDIRSTTRSERSFTEKESKIQELQTNLETAMIERDDFIKRQEIVNVLIGENNQLKAKNQNLVFELDEARKISQKDRKNRRQSSHDEKRLSLWDNTRNASTMTVPTDKSCNCEELNNMVLELKKTLRIKESQIRTMIMESKTNPLMDDNEMLKKLLAEEENSTKKLRIEIIKLTQRLAEKNFKGVECMKCSHRLATIKVEKSCQTENNTNAKNSPESYGSGIVAKVELEQLQADYKKLDKKYEDVKYICRQRLTRITKLENELETKEKENESGNSQETRGSVIQRTRSAAELTQIDILNKQLEEYKEKYKKLYYSNKNSKGQQDIKSECNCRVMAVQTDMDPILAQYETLKTEYKKLQHRLEETQHICMSKKNEIKKLHQQISNLQKH